MWLILYVGGEQLVEKILDKFEKQVSKSTNLRTEAKMEIIKNLKFLRMNKDLFLRLHYSFFYINGKYRNISNRLTGIKYVSYLCTYQFLVHMFYFRFLLDSGCNMIQPHQV